MTSADEIVIESRAQSVVFAARELWAFRAVLYFLAWRDLKVRYRQTVLGALWALIQPLATMLVFVIVFNKVAQISTGPIPYPIFALAGLLPWQLFVFGLTESSNSLVQSQNLIKKIYFPRLIIPLSSMVVGLVDFSLSLLLLALAMVVFGVRPSANVPFILLFIPLAVLAALGGGVWFAALNLRYRDFRFVVPFVAQIMLYLTPVAYPMNIVGAKFRTVLALNPMTSVVEGFRWALLGSPAPETPQMLISTGVSVLLLCAGLVRFRQTESYFADIA